MWTPSSKIIVRPTSGQTVDIAIPASANGIRMTCSAKCAGGADTGIALRINGSSTGITYLASYNNGATVAATASAAFGIATNGGSFSANMQLMTAVGLPRSGNIQESSLSSAGAIVTRREVTVAFTNTSTVISSVGIDLDAGMAFAAGSVIVVEIL